VILDQLVCYSKIVPKNNEEFIDHYEQVYPGSPSGGNPDYGKGLFSKV